MKRQSTPSGGGRSQRNLNMFQPSRSRIIASLLLVALVSPSAAQSTAPVPVYRWTTLAGRAIERAGIAAVNQLLTHDA